MDTTQILLIITSIAGILGFGTLAYFFMGASGAKTGDLRDLMGTGGPTQTGRGGRSVDEIELEAIKRQSGRSKGRSLSSKEDLEVKLFKAGWYAPSDKARFTQIRIACFVISIIVGPVGLYLLKPKPILVLLGLIIGLIIGVFAPMSYLDRLIRKRHEEIFYFLPLVIEQVSIGVSSSLDIGPCVSNIVEMADERDSHNPVTELFVHVEKLLRSGMSLEEALVEVGEANGMNEVKHTFLFLAQCSKHGGELSKQLQELADSVTVQRQVHVEEKITALPVKATGPLSMVFAGFFALLFSGLLVRLMNAFGQ